MGKLKKSGPDEVWGRGSFGGELQGLKGIVCKQACVEKKKAHRGDNGGRLNGKKSEWGKVLGFGNERGGLSWGSVIERVGGYFRGKGIKGKKRQPERKTGKRERKNSYQVEYFRPKKDGN